jgi:hypothetical protein
MGARYLVPALPFFAVAAAGLAAPGGRRPPDWVVRLAWAVALAAVGYAVFMMLAGTAVKPEVPVQIRHPFGDYLLPRFWRGELAVSTQSIDSIGAPPTGPHFAWNLGQLVGLRGLASLLPLALVAAGAGGWLAWAIRDADRAG